MWVTSKSFWRCVFNAEVKLFQCDNLPDILILHNNAYTMFLYVSRIYPFFLSLRYIYIRLFLSFSVFSSAFIYSHCSFMCLSPHLHTSIIIPFENEAIRPFPSILYSFLLFHNYFFVYTGLYYSFFFQCH